MDCRSLVATEQFQLATNSHSASGSVCLWSSCILSRLRSARMWKKFRMRSFWQCSSLGLVNTSVLQPSEFLSFESSNPSTPPKSPSRRESSSNKFVRSLYPAERRQGTHFVSSNSVRLPDFSNIYHAIAIYHLLAQHAHALKHTHTHTHILSFK
jgi:hypothetical protein